MADQGIEGKANEGETNEEEAHAFVAVVQPNTPAILVTKLTLNDVLLGRGAPFINYQGNIRFRELVRTRKAEYIATGKHQVKDEIAREILEEIVRRRGRFLRRVNVEDDKNKDNGGKREKVWRIAEEDVAIEKVKQSLRDREPTTVTQAALPVAGFRGAGTTGSSYANNPVTGNSVVGNTGVLWPSGMPVQGMAVATLPGMMPNATIPQGVVMGSTGILPATATLGMLPAGNVVLAMSLQQRQQEFFRQQQATILQSQLLQSQQSQLLQSQSQLQNSLLQQAQPQRQAFSHIAQNQSVVAGASLSSDGTSEGGCHTATLQRQEELLQELANTPNGSALVASLRANMARLQAGTQNPSNQLPNPETGNADIAAFLDDGDEEEEESDEPDDHDQQEAVEQGHDLQQQQQARDADHAPAAVAAPVENPGARTVSESEEGQTSSGIDSRSSKHGSSEDEAPDSSRQGSSEDEGNDSKSSKQNSSEDEEPVSKSEGSSEEGEESEHPGLSPNEMEDNWERSSSPDSTQVESDGRRKRLKSNKYDRVH